MEPLGGATSDEITWRVRLGDACVAGREHAAALEHYLDAWELLPEPKERWHESQRILTAVGAVLTARGELAHAWDVLGARDRRRRALPSVTPRPPAP